MAVKYAEKVLFGVVSFMKCIFCYYNNADNYISLFNQLFTLSLFRPSSISIQSFGEHFQKVQTIYFQIILVLVQILPSYQKIE